MKIIKEKPKFDGKMNAYWGRVYFISDSRDRKARILWFASLAFLRDTLKKDKPAPADIDHFINRIVETYKKEKNKVFFPVVRYEVYVAGPEDKSLAHESLRKKDKT